MNEDDRRPARRSAVVDAQSADGTRGRAPRRGTQSPRPGGADPAVEADERRGARLLERREKRAPRAEAVRHEGELASVDERERRGAIDGRFIMLRRGPNGGKLRAVVHWTEELKQILAAGGVR